DRLGDLLALDRLDGGLDALVADTDGVLRYRACHDAAAHGVLLLLAGVVPDDDDLPLHAKLLDRIEHADGGALVGAEDALDARMRLEDRLGEVGRLEVIAAAVLDVDDFDLGVLGLHPVDEAIAPVDAGPAGLIVDHGGDFSL